MKSEIDNEFINFAFMFLTFMYIQLSILHSENILVSHMLFSQGKKINI